ncbi:SseB family protein [Actinomadura sp. 3N407]|uniref:SseB family protein n=1 Tax=Actinomadura sp. 3N407 TaxID=3457423 RepID=UPI003FCC3F95
MATVADAWRPTSELEHRLQETVRAGDQESYFRLIADSELVIPVPPDLVDGMLTGETQPSWPTQEEDGRVHVLVYTSASAMRACLGPAYQHFMTVRFGEIAETWPDNRWWLAIDAPAHGVRTALPIEARLPSWFVRQVAQGDGRPPQVGRASPPWEELRDQHRDLPRESPRQEFQPANDVERELLRAAANNDHDLFLQTLAATDVLLPVPDDTDYTMRPGRPGFPWQTREVDGSTVVPVFTSPERLIEAARAAGAGTEYIKLPFTVALRYWPNHDWLLAINSGSPAGGTVLAQQLPGLATWADQRAAQRMTDGFEPQNDVEQRLFDAARRRDTDGFFAILLGAQVLVPADPDTPWGIVPGDAGFPWRPVPVHGRTAIQIFTSLKWMNEAIGSSRFIMPTLLDMVAAWPDTEWTLVINPGTPIDAAMPGDKVRSLGGLPRPEKPATPPAASTPPPPDTPAVPVAPAVPSEPDTSPRDTPGAHAGPPVPAAADREDDRGPSAPGEPAPHEPSALGMTGRHADAPGGSHAPAPGAAGPHSDGGAHGDVGPRGGSGTSDTPANPADVTAADPVAPPGPGPQVGETPQGGPTAPGEHAHGPGSPREAARGAAGASVFDTADPLGAPSGHPGMSAPGGGPHTGRGPTWQDDFTAPDTPGAQAGPGAQGQPSAPGGPGGPGETAPEEHPGGHVVPGETPQPGAGAQGFPTDTPGRETAEGGREPTAAGVPGEPAGMGPPGSPPQGPGPQSGETAPDAPATPGMSAAGGPGPAAHHPGPAHGPASGTDQPPQGGHAAPGMPSGSHETAPGGVAPQAVPSPSPGPTGQPDAPADQNAGGDLGAHHGPAMQGAHAKPDMPDAPGDPHGASQESGPQGGAAPAEPGPAGPDGFATSDTPGPVGAPGMPVAPGAASGQEALGEQPPRAADEPEAAFEPGNRIDQELHEATLSGDSDAFLRVLLNANVLVPIPDDAALEVTPVQREFRWDAALRTESSVQVFTSLVRLREVLPESRFVYADFRELIGAWPREDWTMLLNPGTRIGASLRGDQVQALSEWAVRVGLVQARPEVPLPPPRPEPAPQMPPDLDDRVSSPSIMQKVVPHGHVAWYLEQGYDRVGGFVHSTGDVAELQTPVQLYEALGLLYEGSSFSSGDEGVYVIRWPAYCPDLYRIPFGGRDEEERATWGEAGWVIERPPFTGSGFAPGSAGSIREYKVDSVRLPYGAEMYYLGRDRSERFVAMYDPDRLAWLRPDANADAWDGRTEAAQ